LVKMMKLQKILFGFLLVVGANTFAMDQESSEKDSVTSLVTGMRSVQQSHSLVSLASATTSTETLASSQPGAFAKKLCRYPSVCHSYNELKRAAGAAYKSCDDLDIADSRARISSPVRSILTAHASNPVLFTDMNGENIVQRGGSLLQENPVYPRFLAVIKDPEVHHVIMSGSVSSPELRMLDSRIAVAVRGDLSHISIFEDGATE
jgi:hypothetical protein